MYRKLLRTEDLSDCAKSLICGTRTLPSAVRTAVKKMGFVCTMYIVHTTAHLVSKLLTISGDDNDFVNLLLVKLQVL